jgi:hypothetical protein
MSNIDNIQIDFEEPVSKVEPQSTNEISFEEKVRQYVIRVKPTLCILTPCYGSLCYVNYVTCLINTIKLFDSFNIPITYEFCRNDSLVSRARNNLVAKAMSKPNITHMIFIDNDITWNPIDILKLLIADKNLVGGAYPIKYYDWSKISNPDKNVIGEWLQAKYNSQINEFVDDISFIQNKLLRYNINYKSNIVEIHNNLAKVKHLATGFMMIRRDTIEKMSKAFPSTKYVDDVNFLEGSENDHAYALFDCGVEEGHYFSEDWLFCSRWTKMGGDIWLDVSINLTHTGNEDYNGSYLSSIIGNGI